MSSSSSAAAAAEAPGEPLIPQQEALAPEAIPVGQPEEEDKLREPDGAAVPAEVGMAPDARGSEDRPDALLPAPSQGSSYGPMRSSRTTRPSELPYGQNNLFVFFQSRIEGDSPQKEISLEIARVWLNPFQQRLTAAKSRKPREWSRAETQKGPATAKAFGAARAKEWKQ